MTKHELIAREPPDIERALPVSKLRSTLLSSSLRVLGEHDLLDRYFTQLPAPLHEELRTLIPGTWVRLALAAEHYRACDRLGLAAKDIETNGAAVGKRVHESVLKTLVNLASGVGATPWTAFALVPKLTARLWIGGAVEVWKAGPKDGIITIKQLPLFGIGYFRASYRGVVRAAFDLFARTVYVREIPDASSNGQYGVRVSWV